MITYAGPLDNATELIAFLRRELPNLRALRKLVISAENTVVMDVNRDGIEFPGLTYGNPVLERVLEELGVIYQRESLHSFTGTREFRLSARWTWGHDRVM